MSGFRRTGGLAVDSFGARVRDRNLIAPPPTSAAGLRSADLSRYAFPLGFVAVVLVFALPGSLLTYLGVYSDAPGGNPLTKFHPATYMAILAAWFALYGARRGGGVSGLFRERPALAWAIVLILTSMVYSGLSTAVGKPALYIETYLAPALLLIAIETGTERQLRMLGYAILAFALFNVVFSVIEGQTQTHYLPLSSSLKVKYDSSVDEFRGQALYGHPLTGALVTSMAFFLALGMRLRPWVALAVLGGLFTGLMSFGGRNALFTTVIVITAAALFQLSAGLVTRRLSVGFLAAFIAGSLLLPAFFVVLTSMTDIGQRILTHLYLDDSAEIRVVQWSVLDFMNAHDFLFGMSFDRIDLMKAQIGFTKPGMDIENCWLLMFLNLGVFGFPFLVGGLFLLLLHLGQRTNTPMGWLLVTAALLICSGSNSLGQKTPDLVFLAAFATALSGFRPQQSVPIAARQDGAADPIHRTGLPAHPEGRVRALSERPLARTGNSLLSGEGPA
jgi:hypothetical protein